MSKIKKTATQSIDLIYFLLLIEKMQNKQSNMEFIQKLYGYINYSKETQGEIKKLLLKSNKFENYLNRHITTYYYKEDCIYGFSQIQNFIKDNNIMNLTFNDNQNIFIKSLIYCFFNYLYFLIKDTKNNNRFYVIIIEILKFILKVKFLDNQKLNQKLINIFNLKLDKKINLLLCNTILLYINNVILFFNKKNINYPTLDFILNNLNNYKKNKQENIINFFVLDNSIKIDKILYKLNIKNSTEFNSIKTIIEENSSFITLRIFAFLDTEEFINNKSIFIKNFDKNRINDLMKILKGYEYISNCYDFIGFFLDINTDMDLLKNFIKKLKKNEIDINSVRSYVSGYYKLIISNFKETSPHRYKKVLENIYKKSK